MGGYGSGRCSTTAKIDAGLKLNINKLKNDGMLELNSWRSGRLKWSNVCTDEETASIGYETNTLNPNDMWIRVHYTHTSYWDDEPDKMDYKIKLETTQPNYGGKRLWFICPLTQKRAAVLFSPSGSKWFASRHAFNLKYQSQSRSAHDRAIDRMWKLKNKLGGEEYWHKPKGMHWKTYERMVEEIDDAEDLCDGYLAEFVMRRLGSLEGIL
jgi:hypothetical protein